MTEITAPGTYTVTFDGERLSSKRFNDAIKLIKGLDQLEETTATYDSARRAWTVTLPEGSQRGLSDLRIAARSYGATVEPASTVQVDRAALAAERRTLILRLAEIDRTLDAQ
jgi:hypothetical protein